MNKYEFERRKLKELIPESLIEEFDGVDESFYIAGGAITSIFTNKDINDLDIYPKSVEALYKLIEYCDNNTRVESCTDKSVFSVMFENGNEVCLNIICLDTYKSPDDIFKTFDFSIVKGAFDMDSEEFYLHEEFLLDLSKRNLRCDTNTSFPLMSILRINKYLDRGYNISKNEIAKMLLKVSTLNISSIEEAEKHLGGLYGIEVGELFKDKPFSLSELMDMMSYGRFDLNHKLDKKKIEKKFKALKESVDKRYCDTVDVTGLREYKGGLFKELSPYVWQYIPNTYPDSLKVRELSPDDLDFLYIYKDIKLSDDKLVSHHNPRFEYSKEGDIVPDSHGKLYFYVHDKDNGQYQSNKDSYRIKCIARFKDIVGYGRYGNTDITVSKCRFVETIRENINKKK